MTIEENRLGCGEVLEALGDVGIATHGDDVWVVMDDAGEGPFPVAVYLDKSKAQDHANRPGCEGWLVSVEYRTMVPGKVKP